MGFLEDVVVVVELYGTVVVVVEIVSPLLACAWMGLLPKVKVGC